LAGDGLHISEYDPSLADAILGEAAFLLRAIGFAAHHTILIGGLVPGLLVLDPGPGRPAHVGTADIDLCLSVALVEGNTAEYERIEAALKKADYALTDDTFCWRRASGLRLKVEFFCPASPPEREAGDLFRPKAADAPVPKHNMGSRLSAIALDAGAAVSADAQDVERDVTLPDGGGTVRQRFRVTGLVGFLVAKVAALVGRDKPKDAYDIVWLLEAWEGGPAGAAATARHSSIIDREDVQSALATLAREFADLDRFGPRSYSRFLAAPDATQDDRDRLAQQAVGAVREFLRGLENGDAEPPAAAS
jgi:hypothetical protein